MKLETERKKAKKSKSSKSSSAELALISTSAQMDLSKKPDKSAASLEKINKLNEKCTTWYSYFNDALTRARNYLTFLYVDQWEYSDRQSRESMGKPALTLNKLVAIINGSLGEYRNNTPALSVRALDDKISQDQIDLYNDLIRQIHYASDGPTQYQTAFKLALETGWSAFKVSIDFENSDTFDQCISLCALHDFQSAFWDCASRLPDKSDGDFCGWYDVVSKDDFKLAYPDINPQSASNGYYFISDLRDVVIVCNIYRKEYFRKTIVKLSDGRELSLDDANESIEENKLLIAQHEILVYQANTQLAENGLPSLDGMTPEIQLLEIIEKRSLMDYKIKYYRFVQDAILEESEWPGKLLPIVYVDGNSTVIDGKRIPIAYIQDVIDAQRFENYVFSETAYSINRSRKEQWMGTKANFQGYEQIWRNPDQVQGALQFNPDPKTGQGPARIDPTSFDQSLLSALSTADNAIGSILGRYDENRGNESNAISGVAIDKRQRTGNMPINMYIDNVSRGIEQVGKIIMELIPHVYNNERSIVVRDAKGNAKTVPINQQMNTFSSDENGNVKRDVKNDITSGKYDIEVRIDGSYDQQRLDSLNTLISFAQVNPAFGQIIPDMIAENSGLENSQVLIERAKTLLPPNIIALENGQPPPPPPQPQQDPMIMVQMEKMKNEQVKLQLEQQKLKNEQLETALKASHQQNQLQMEKYKTDMDFKTQAMTEHSRLLQTHIKSNSGNKKRGNHE